MRRVLKWLGIILFGLVAIVGLVALAGYVASERRLNRAYEVAGRALTLPSDAASVAEGQRLTIIRGCVDCHGADYGGQIMIDSPLIGRAYGPNLTAGQGSATADFTVEDWDRAVRHGLGPDGRPLFVMPSYHYAGLSDEDLGRMIAFLRAAPPVDRAASPSSAGPLTRLMLVANQPPPLLSAEVIDHNNPPPASIATEASPAFGAYLASSCNGCHGENLAGGPVPFSEPDSPKAANLTPAGELSSWTLDGFKNTLRTGVTPGGRELDPLDMPWPLTAQMTDIEIEALWLYLQSLPPATPAG